MLQKVSLLCAVFIGGLLIAGIPETSAAPSMFDLIKGSQLEVWCKLISLCSDEEDSPIYVSTDASTPPKPSSPHGPPPITTPPKPKPGPPHPTTPKHAPPKPKPGPPKPKPGPRKPTTHKP